MTIACATHFTPASDEAVRVASALARQSGERLVMATISTKVERYAVAAGVQRRHLARSLELEADRVRLRGLHVDARLLEGELEGCLIELCRSTAARLLVVGDSRLDASRLAAPLERLLDEVPVPLLVVHGGRGFQNWAAARPLEVVLGVDHSWSAAMAVRWVSELAAWGPVHVTAVHVWTPDGEFDRRRLEPTSDARSLARLAVDLHHEAEAALESLPEEVTRHVRLELGARARVAGHLLAEAARVKADLLVVGTHQHRTVLGALRSVSSELLAEASMSVAFIPPLSDAPRLSRSLG